MKYSKLDEIVRMEAYYRKECAAQAGSYTDGGSSSLLLALAEFKHELVVKYDLRPSEYYQLSDKEVGEPEVFSEAIRRHKMQLASEYVKNLKL